MIFINRTYLIVAISIFIAILLFLVFLTFCAIFAYRYNAKLEHDDPEKKDFARLAPWLSPITPIFWIGRMILLAPLSIPFGMFLILFPFILIIFRPLPDNSASKHFILKVGNKVLKINTSILHAFGLHTKPIVISM